MGANWLGMALCKDKRGLTDKIVASVCFQAPCNVAKSMINVKKAWGGFISWALGIRFSNVVKSQLDYLVPVYKQLYNFDLLKFLDNLKGVHEFEEKINWKIYKCKDVDEYHRKYSTSTHI